MTYPATRFISRFAIGFALAMSCFFLWNDSFDAQVLSAGVLSAILAALFVLLTRARGERSLRVGVASAWPLLVAFVRLPVGTWHACVFFVRAVSSGCLKGRLRTHSAGLNNTSSAAGAGARAMLVLAECLAPDSFVVDVDQDHRLVIHEIGVKR